MTIGKRATAEFLGTFWLVFAGAAVLHLIVSGKGSVTDVGGFAANGYGDHSPGGFGVISAFVAETVCTFHFLMVILGATDKRAPAVFAASRSVSRSR